MLESPRLGHRKEWEWMLLSLSFNSVCGFDGHGGRRGLLSLALAIH